MSDEIRHAVQQWLAKAEADWIAVEILSVHERCPRDTVCFHCQQHVEKLLKAFLTLHGIEAPKTHSLRRLIQVAQGLAPELSSLIDQSDDLTAHGVETRYPDDWRAIDAAEMNEMIELARAFGVMLMSRLKQ